MAVEMFKQGLELFADQWQAPGTIDFYASGDLDDYIRFSATSNRPLITGVGNYLVLGKDGTAGSATSADDVIVGGKLEVDGVLYTDGGISSSGTITVGASDTGYDVKFWGATANNYMLWDESEDRLFIDGTNATLHIGEFSGATSGQGTKVTATQTAQPGTYAFTIYASGGGKTKSTIVNVVVHEGSPPTTTTTTAPVVSPFSVLEMLTEHSYLIILIILVLVIVVLATALILRGRK